MTIEPGLPTAAEADAVRPLIDVGVGLRLISTLCGSTSCPTIYESDRGTLIVQGYAVTADSTGVDLPDGENLVEIPIDLLAEAARSLPLTPEPTSSLS
ncbi:MAG TPA: hypothetical protein VFR35_19415 [Actinoplanes sp.]|nr:hypothetical protein [Actinoplanes sp.]